MTSSKSSRLRQHRSTLSLRLPSFLTEKPVLEGGSSPEVAATIDGSVVITKSRGSCRSEVDLSLTAVPQHSQQPPSESQNLNARRRTTLGGLGDGEIPERRKSRIGLLTSFLQQPLTSFSTRTESPPSLSPEQPPERVVERKPLPASAAVPDFTAMTDSTRLGHRPSYSVGTTLGPPPEARGTPDVHQRKSSIGFIFKKLHKASTQPMHPPPQIPHPSLNHASTIAVGEEPKTTTSVLKRSERSRSRSQSRSRSVDRVGKGKLQPTRTDTRGLSPGPEPRGRSSSAQPPHSRDGVNDGLRPVTRDGPGEGLRVVSGPAAAVAASQHSRNTSDESEGSATGRLRKSWFPGYRGSPTAAGPGSAQLVEAWVLAPDCRVEYNANPLVNGDKVPELWNENGNVTVYLFPKESGRGPQFKVPDHVFSSAAPLTELMLAELISRANEPSPETSLDPNASPAPSPPLRRGAVESHLYLPLGNTDLERLVAARNLFAFLTGQPLVGIKTRDTIFEVLLQISALLRKFGFTNWDGSSFGDEVDRSFTVCMDTFKLADVRNSSEKTLEALVLGEQMRSWTLYNEGFCHAIGKYDSLLELRSPLYGSISSSTRTRLERAYLDLMNRRDRVKERLEAFEFPGLFAGIASSTSTEEYKNVRFKEWRNNFAKMRNFVLGYYKDQFGSWPPKARSKRNQFSQSGLNRQALKILYSDLCALYDLLVNRELLTTRDIDQDPEELEADIVDPIISALRKVLSEFDHSQPPVLPPIPFDVPRIPHMTSIHENYNDLPPKKQAKLDKSIQSNELSLVMIKSHNIDTDLLNVPFLSAFKEFELKEAKGVLPQDWADQRVGFWLFLYAVIQSLPMLVVDAPDLHYTEGVEYFLCEPPMGNLPWMEDAGEVRKMWYQTAGQGIVELSADVVMFSVEATYMRSHCWLAAKEWEQTNGLAPPPPALPEAETLEELAPPPTIFQDMDPMASPSTSAGPGSRPGSNSSSPQLRPRRNLSPGGAFSRTSHYRSSTAIGLEPVALDGTGLPDRSSRVPSLSGISGGNSRPGSSSGLRPVHARTLSSTNLSQMTRDGSPSGSVTLPAAGGHMKNDSMGDGSTFDDILKGMEPEKEKKSKKRFPF